MKRSQKEFMRSLRPLTYFTQFGISVISPILLCTFVGVWLYNRFALGVWVLLLFIFLGIGGAVSSFLSIFRIAAAEQALEEAEENKQEEDRENRCDR